MAGTAAIPDSTKNSVISRLATRARDRWPQISRVNTRFKGGFCYLDTACGLYANDPTPWT